MYLDSIVAHKKADPDYLHQAEVDWESRLGSAPARRSLVDSLRSAPAGEPSIIAEMKRASPSKGSFHFAGTVCDQVSAYQRGGARALSVLTERAFFEGNEHDLQQARQAVTLPVLRKDFLLAPWEIAQSKVWQADAVLLIAAILDDRSLTEMIQAARRVDLEVLLEIHDEAELERVLALPEAPHAVGINNRDLRTFELSLQTTERLAPRLPKEICRVSESGFATRQDLQRFDGVVDAFLIGETLMRSPRPEETLLGWIKG